MTNGIPAGADIAYTISLQGDLGNGCFPVFDMIGLDDLSLPDPERRSFLGCSMTKAQAPILRLILPHKRRAGDEEANQLTLPVGTGFHEEMFEMGAHRIQ